MKRILNLCAVGAVALLAWSPAAAQVPGEGAMPTPSLEYQGMARDPRRPLPAPTPKQEAPRPQPEVTALPEPQGAGQKADDEQIRKQLDVQHKQILVLEKMVRLLAEQLKKVQPGGEAEVATLEVRARQAARRDQDTASAIDDLREQADADKRNGPWLPPTLRELFLPSRTNESPLSIYGTLTANFVSFQDSKSTFPAPDFSPHIYLLLNEHFLLEANPDFSGSTLDVESAQLDWFLTDHLTLVVGRFYSPLGFFNEKLHTTWIFKTPDRPLVFQQVLPAQLSFNGAQLRGATYLGDWPVKLEYTGFVSNGFSLTAARPTPRDFADLRAMQDTLNDVNNDKAWAGRLGLSFPTLGLIVGVSGLANGAYDRDGQFDLNLWDVDVNWHYGNWDVRFEYANTRQQAPGSPIHRQGFYAQAAYRPYDLGPGLLQKLEGVLRFDYVQFDGIDLAQTGLSFGSREAIPVDRNRYTVGLNYYPYPSLIFKVAYEINEERRTGSLRDNGFLAQMAWGF
jgi:hypothetical protein